MNTLKLVREFREACGLPCYPEYTVITPFEAKTLMFWLASEFSEFIEAELTNDKACKLKELCDIWYVTLGACHGVGIWEDAEDFELLDDDVFSTYCGHETFFLGLQLFAEGLDVSDEETIRKALKLMLETVQILARNLQIPTSKIYGAFNAVHASNMLKFDENGKPYKDITGKVIKGPNYIPPDIHKYLV